MKSQYSNSLLFDPESLDNELTNFSIEAVPGIEEKRKKIILWIDEFTSGRIAHSKEEEIKPRFLNEIFGDVLGYAFRGPNSWNARPEFKTLVDATKADAALGIFVLTETSVLNEVIVVVEIKDSSSDLDSTKNSNNQTPVDQAFGYAHKTKASWVVVSNFQEIRLYNSSFSGQYETFLLKDLNQDSFFKRFIMLLHRQNLMDGSKSRVDKLYELQHNFSPSFFLANRINSNDHIVDQLWKSLKRFDGMMSIDPFIVANITPFNILDEYVWHYDPFHLFTLNPNIFRLLKELQFESDGTVVLTNNLRDELKNAKVADFEEKLGYIFKRLRASLIHTISAVSDHNAIKHRETSSIGFSVRHIFHFSEEEEEGISKFIAVRDFVKCECVNCLFESFNFKAVFKKLKQKTDPSLDIAYGHYLVAGNGFKQSFELYCSIITDTESNPSKRVEHFLAHYNQQLLFNLISWYDDPDRDKMLSRIKAIDLDELLYTSFNSVDRDVREALKELRDDRVALRTKKKVDELLEHLRETKKTYDRGGSYHAIGNYTNQLHFYLCYYYAFVHRNYLISSVFTNYQELIQKIFEGLLISYGLHKYPYKLLKFNLIHLMVATTSIQSQKLEELLRPYAKIDVEKNDIKLYLERVKDFLTSHFDTGIFNRVSMNPLMQEYLLVGHFKETCSRIFANTFLFLSRLKISSSSWNTEINLALINFLKAQDYLHWYHLDKLGKFLEVKGTLFSSDQIEEILVIANKKNEYGNSTYPPLIKSASKSFSKWFPERKIEDEAFIYKAIADATGEKNRVRYMDLIAIYKSVGLENQHRIKSILDRYLEASFNTDCYERCVHEEIFTVNYKDYFEKYVQGIDKNKGKGLIKVENDVADFQDFIFYNFIILIRRNGVSENDQRLKFLTNLSLYERWLLYPNSFDYNEFNPEWLIASDHVDILKSIRHIEQLKTKTYVHLQKGHSNVLSKIYFSLLA